MCIRDRGVPAGRGEHHRQQCRADAEDIGGKGVGEEESRGQGPHGEGGQGAREDAEQAPPDVVSDMCALHVEWTNQLHGDLPLSLIHI